VQPRLLYAVHVRQLAGEKSRPNLMEVKGSEAQGRHREVGSEGSVEQKIRADGQELDLRPTASDERATDREVRIHQGRWW